MLSPQTIELRVEALSSLTAAGPHGSTEVEEISISCARVRFNWLKSESVEKIRYF